MKPEEVDFDHIAKRLAHSEDLNKTNEMKGDWGTGRAPAGPPTTARSLRWIMEGLIGTSLVMGLTSLGVAAPYRNGLKARFVHQGSSIFSTVTIDPHARVPPEEPQAKPVAGPAPPPASSPKRERRTRFEDPGVLLTPAEQPNTRAPKKTAALAETGSKPSTPTETTESPTEDEAGPVPLPESLSRAAVHRALSPLRAKVLACREQAPSEATVVSVTVVVDPDGSVEDVQVEGPVGASPAAACVAAVVKAARFDPWDGPAQTVSYPFSLK